MSIEIDGRSDLPAAADAALAAEAPAFAPAGWMRMPLRSMVTS
jgi:hypothetical protein